MGGDEIAALGHCSVNGSLHSLEHKTLALLKDAGKTAQGWSELLLVTDGTEGYENTVINAWKVILPTAPGVSNEGGSSELLVPFAGCFLALGFGLGLVGTASARR